MTKKTKNDAAPAKKPAHDLALLRKLSGRISDYPRGVPAEVVDDLKTIFGMKTIERPKGSGQLVIRLAGISTKPCPTMDQALTNWSNKARRVMLKAAA